MATDPKIKRSWIKQEKQIVKLLYQKGLLQDYNLDNLYWAEYHRYNNKKYKSSYGKYSWPVYMPEVHYMTTDYWGESDEHSIVGTIKDEFWWGHAEMENWDDTSGEWPNSTFPIMTREQFIKYLEKLPTKVNDNKINKVLKTQRIDE